MSLQKISREHLCISLLVDEHYRQWDTSTAPKLRWLSCKPFTVDVCGDGESHAYIVTLVEAFKASLAMSDEAMHLT